MIIDKIVEVKVPYNIEVREYYQNLGYSLIPLRQKGYFTKLLISVEHLLPKSHVKVNCVCEGCFGKYNVMFHKNTTFCLSCQRRDQLINNDHWKNSPIGNCGNQHHNWNPNKTEFQKYANKVRLLTEKTYENYKHILNPNRLERVLLGQDGYQLDHIISVKKCFDLGFTEEFCSSLNNLQVLSTRINRLKWA